MPYLRIVLHFTETKVNTNKDESQVRPSFRGDFRPVFSGWNTTKDKLPDYSTKITQKWIE